MAESISQRFIAALAAARDSLYGDARLRAGLGGTDGTARRAEGLLQVALHSVFERYAAADGGAASAPEDVATAVREALQGLAPRTGTGGAEVGEPLEPEPMPADVWARLTAAVQVEAAKLPGGPMVNPDSVLLTPDPLLAPRRARPADELTDGLNFSSTSRFIVAAALALVLGVAVTLYLTTRKAPPRTADTAAAPGVAGR